MKKRVLTCIRWCIPLLLAGIGVLFWLAIPGYSFTGLICFGLAGIALIYNLIALMKKRSALAAKVLRTVFSSLLCIFLAVVLITLSLVIRVSFGEEDTNCEYIVVLGAKVNGTTPSRSLSERIDAAYAYLKAHPGVYAVLSGGQGPDEGISEAQCMYDNLTQMGISSQRLWLEDCSTSTWENLVFSLDLIEEKTGSRPTTLGIVSSEYHLFRADLLARACGVNTQGIPAHTKWLSLRINNYLREVAGVWHYLIFGGYGYD